MKIVYVAKHSNGGTDDEGAIAHALKALGHQVVRVHETDASANPNKTQIPDGDLLLFHKWAAVDCIKRFNGKKVFWYFDLVDYPDLEIQRRNHARMQWMDTITPLVNIGFCTDGDWVRKVGAPLKILRQGADERFLDSVTVPTHHNRFNLEILMTGIRYGGGKGRASFVDFMEAAYPKSFRCINRGVYQLALLDAISASRFVVCPDHPITDWYWSNRVYNACGFGGMVLHPYASELCNDYTDKKHLAYYHNRTELIELVRYYTSHPEEALAIRAKAHAITKANHTYRARCIKLLEEVAKL